MRQIVRTSVVSGIRLNDLKTLKVPMEEEADRDVKLNQLYVDRLVNCQKTKKLLNEMLFEMG